jgi:succinylglutamate desuccinylase
MQKKLKNILFLATVHGNEKIGMRALRQLEKDVPIKNFSWVIANTKAFSKNKRFIDVDLNRVAPGNKNAREYERRRAYELLKIGRNYRYVIDIHGTGAPTGIFTIVTNPKKTNLILATRLPIKNVVLWVGNNDRQGPLTQFFKCAVEIECGPKNSKIIQKKLLGILRYIVEKINFSDINFCSSKNVFQVYDKISRGEISKKETNRLKEFQQITINRERFYPIFIDRYKDILCYKMKKINFYQKFFSKK